MNYFLSFNLAHTTYLILCYTTLAYWLSLGYKNLTILKKLTWFGTSCANFLLFTLLLGRWITESYFPLSNLYESLLFLSWCLLFLVLFLEFKTRTKLIGAILFPILLLISVFTTLVLPIPMQEASPLVPALQSNWLMMHVSMMMVSYSTLILGSLLSILFLVIKKVSNLKQVTNTNSLLTTIDVWSYRIIGLGFPLLTIGILSGAVWANEAWGSYWSWDPKETWALITWLIFATYIHARLIKGWKGIQAATISSIGFICVWICYLGVNFLGQGLHSYGFLS